MKKSLFITLAAMLGLSAAACDATTTLCMEEYDCATNKWCINGAYDYSFSSEAACKDFFYDRYDACLDEVNRAQRDLAPSCYEAYDNMNSCIWSHTSCTSDYDAYVNKMNDIIYYNCSSQAQNYADACGVNFEDAYTYLY